MFLCNASCGVVNLIESFTTQINPDDVITDYTVFVIMTTILCAVLAFPSILVGMPAIYLAVQVSPPQMFTIAHVIYISRCVTVAAI